METKWAEENLQTIRTLMERSAVYRRALAPIMIYVGALGVASCLVGLSFDFDSFGEFDALWLGTAVIAVGGAFLIARRQALKAKEAFWSPPTRRVAQALLPPLLAGMCLGAFSALANPPEESAAFVWMVFYGCALHGAGFFMSRGIKAFGICFILAGCGLFYALAFWESPWPVWLNANVVMGFFFGALHLAYGIYLYFTESRKTVA